MSISLTPLRPDNERWRLARLELGDDDEDYLDPDTPEYGRSNVIWFAIWNIVCDACSDQLTEDQREHGSSSSGVVISAEQSQSIADAMAEILEGGEAKQYVRAMEDWVAANRPPVTCRSCNGTGRGEPPLMLSDGSCILCRGTGKTPQPGFEQLLCESDIASFVAFAECSGGFRIS